MQTGMWTSVASVDCVSELLGLGWFRSFMILLISGKKVSEYKVHYVHAKLPRYPRGSKGSYTGFRK